MITKESVLQTLEALQTNVCAYSFMKKSTICDCKFKKLDAPLNPKSETGCGCPELEWVLRHLNGMTEKQWDKFLQGKRKK